MLHARNSTYIFYLLLLFHLALQSLVCPPILFDCSLFCATLVSHLHLFCIRSHLFHLVFGDALDCALNIALRSLASGIPIKCPAYCSLFVVAYLIMSSPCTTTYTAWFISILRIWVLISSLELFSQIFSETSYPPLSGSMFRRCRSK